MMRFASAAALAALALTDVVHAKIYDTRFEGTKWDDKNWRLTTTNLDQGHYESRMSLANGYLGINVAVAGPFFEVDTPVAGDQINGWPLFDRRQTFATIAGFYDFQATTNGTNFEWLNQYGGESVISGVPHWAGLHVQVGDDLLGAGVPEAQITGFSSTLDIGAGMMHWKYTWTPSGGPAIKIEYSMLVHKLYVNQAAVQVKITAAKDVDASVIDVLDGDCAVRTDFINKGYEANTPAIWTAVSPNGVKDVSAYTSTPLSLATTLATRPLGPSTRRNQSSAATAHRLHRLWPSHSRLVRRPSSPSTLAVLPPMHSAALKRRPGKALSAPQTAVTRRC